MQVTLIQAPLIWENPKSNRDYFEAKINSITENIDLIVLPEMFTSGFTMSPETVAETMQGETITWLKALAKARNCAFTGSLVIKENGNFYNRLVFVFPSGEIQFYDKRHLFAFAGEDQHYTAGAKRLIASVKGWKINLQVCYDLRFPVWARQQGEEYDVLLYVANWPEKRNHAWKTLLTARAIENQCYTIGVNRVGIDGNNIAHSGDSLIVGPLGEVLYHCAYKEDVFTITLQKQELTTARNQFPFWKDADFFQIQ